MNELNTCMVYDNWKETLNEAQKQKNKNFGRGEVTENDCNDAWE